MFGIGRARELEGPPHQRAHRKVQGMKRSIAQYDRGNLRPQLAEPLRRDGVFFRFPPADTRGDIEQLAAIPAEDGLDLAMRAAIRTAGKCRAILAPWTLEMKRPAHFFSNTTKPEHYQS